MVDITIVNGVYKPTYNWGAPSCILFYSIPFPRLKPRIHRSFHQPPPYPPLTTSCAPSSAEDPVTDPIMHTRASSDSVIMGITFEVSRNLGWPCSNRDAVDGVVGEVPGCRRRRSQHVWSQRVSSSLRCYLTKPSRSSMQWNKQSRGDSTSRHWLK
jgi:hypothetical protein